MQRLSYERLSHERLSYDRSELFSLEVSSLTPCRLGYPVRQGCISVR